jgi:hypothetical protein
MEIASPTFSKTMRSGRIDLTQGLVAVRSPTSPSSATTPRSSPPGKQIYQALALAAVFDNRHTVLGLWMIDQDCCGVGVRESFSPITGNLSSFVPRFFS